MQIETIPLPRAQLKERRPVHLEVEPDAMPGNRFRLRFDWNNRMEEYVFRLKHLPTATWVTQGPPKLAQEYALGDEIAFMFYDPSGDADTITPATIGGPVRLGVFNITPAAGDSA